MKHNDNCILISNDLYRDLSTYVKKYNNTINIKILQNNTKSISDINLQSNILNNMNNIQYKRSAIPKNKLYKIII